MIPEDPFVLFELANKDKLIKDIRYYIKDYYEGKKYTEIYATFIYYLEDELIPHAFFRANTRYSFYQNLSPTVIHRLISKEEYFKKVKEKYDSKCLNIILKRLVDESFQSDFL